MKRLLISAACLAVSFSCFADSIECDGCALPAMTLRATDAGNGPHYFFDFTGQRLTHLDVSGITNPQVVRGLVRPDVPGGGGVTVTNVPITAEEQQTFNAALAVWSANSGKSLVTGTPFSESIPITSVTSSSRASAMLSAASTGIKPQVAGLAHVVALDTLTNQQAMDAAINGMWSTTSSTPFQVYATYVRTSLINFVNVVKISLLGTPITLQEQIVFPDDNSSIIVQFNFATQSYSYVQGSARDGAGNPIPLTLQQVVGGPNSSYFTYNFPNTPIGQIAGTEAVDNLNRIGIAMSFPSGVQINNGWQLACGSGGGVTHCDVVPNPG